MSNTTTQINESINSSITRYRDKDLHFPVSNDARSSLTIEKKDYHFESHIPKFSKTISIKKQLTFPGRMRNARIKKNESCKKKIKSKTKILP